MIAAGFSEDARPDEKSASRNRAVTRIARVRTPGTERPEHIKPRDQFHGNREISSEGALGVIYAEPMDGNTAPPNQRRPPRNPHPTTRIFAHHHDSDRLNKSPAKKNGTYLAWHQFADRNGFIDMFKARQSIVFALTVLISCVAGTYLAFFHSPSPVHYEGAVAAESKQSSLRLEDIPFDGKRAFGYLERLCQIGPRFSGSAGMRTQQELLENHFQKLGGNVSWQRFAIRHPLDGSRVDMANLVVTWHPERADRILLCVHYDTRPRPDRDSNNPDGTFIGANDGASGVSILMEMAEWMKGYEGPWGVDFALFDGEEFVWNDRRDTYFLGATWFAQQYVKQPPSHRYRWGVLLDMVGDANLELKRDRYSVSWNDTRPLVDEIWTVARRLGVHEFSPRLGPEVLDDHIPLHNIAGIPTCDIIDFDYPYWHTTRDVPENCSALSLAKVGWVVLEWLQAKSDHTPNSSDSERDE